LGVEQRASALVAATAFFDPTITTMEKTPKPPAASLAPQDSGNCPRLLSADIFKGSAMVEIEHAGQRYLLRVTRENKLILTK
jgi:hemin uptake protein HemP